MIVLLAAGGVSGLLVAEVALRISGRGRQFVVSDPAIGYRLTPDFTRVLRPIIEPVRTLRTNNLGLRRDGATSPGKAPGTRRVLVLGDSQTEGLVDNQDTFTTALEELLSSKAGAPPIEVLNGGASGYSPLLEILWLREYGLRLQPDVVVLALYIGNDIGELTARQVDFGGLGPWLPIATVAHEDGAWRPLRAGAPSAPAMLDVWLRAHLATYDLVRAHMGPPAVERIAALESGARQCQGCMQALWQQWIAENRSPAFEQALLDLRQILALFRQMTLAAGALPVVVLLPTKLEVEGELARQSVDAAAAALNLAAPHPVFAQGVRTRILAAGSAENLEVHDLLPPLQRAHLASGRAMYWDADWHLNPVGNRVIAASLEPLVSTALDARAQP